MDELQHIWEAHQLKVDKAQYLDEFEIRQQLQIKSRGALQKINHVMRWDAILMAFVTCMFIFVTFMLNLESRYTISTILFGVMILLGVHYWIKYHLINKHNLDHDNIADIINKKLKYLKWNKHIYIYGIPIIFLSCFIYFEPLWAQTMPDIKVWYIYILGMLLTSFVFLLSKRLYKRLYGKEIKILEEIIQQLNY